MKGKVLAIRMTSILIIYRGIQHFLLMLIKQGTSMVKKIMSIHTICEAVKSEPIYKTMLSEVHKLLRLYITVLISSATSEKMFSALKHVLTYLRASMTE